jgi:Cdc6-like AAA superfamily ATPase
MKFFETHFEEYITENEKADLHPKNNEIYKRLPENICNLPNLIFYGPSGTGKYTQMLKSIKKYSPTELKYEKKISLTYNKQQYFLKISDIHYEIDFSLLGCNAKQLWHEIYQQIIDIISSKTDKSGIIVCKFFHEIHIELLENFYSYMQKNYDINVDLKFIIITEELSFIPDNILNCCEIIRIARPAKTTYMKCLKKKNINLKTNVITNIKMLHLNNENLMLPHKIICNKIIDNLMNINTLHFLSFRDILYDIFIYNLDITECVWYVLVTLIENNAIGSKDISDILIQTFLFFQYYNNNYRPIFHVEKYFLYLTKIIHKI